MIATVSRRLGAVGLVLAIGLVNARAADASAWDGDARSAVRIIAGTPISSDGTKLRAGVEVRLAPGWKTYWRYPGDSGVPPRFDFAQSSNVQSATLRWPSPHRFGDANGQSIGYEDSVIFPVEVVAKDPLRPVTLRLKLDYAVCEKLCVPADGSVELLLVGAPGAAANDGTLAAAEARVPKPAPVGGGAAFAIRSVRQEPGARFPHLVVDVAAPTGAKVDLFAEGPTPEWALPLPAPVDGGPPGIQRFAFDLDGVPPGASAQGATLTLTAVADGTAIEVKARLD
jgi:DsbC/DsbD-like thiol-disulfide interchange protein